MNGQQWDFQYGNHFYQLPWIGAEMPINLLLDFAIMLPNNKKALDFGCGNGRMAKVLLQFGCKMTCIDISAEAIKLCKKNLSGITDVRYEIADNPRHIKEYYDGIIFWNTIHHIEDVAQLDFVNGLYERLSTNGVLLISGFNNRDTQFQNKRLRVSPTTNFLTYSINDQFFENSKLGTRVIRSGTMKLNDGITNHQRLIQYFFLKKNQV